MAPGAQHPRGRVRAPEPRDRHSRSRTAVTSRPNKRSARAVRSPIDKRRSDGTWPVTCTGDVRGDICGDAGCEGADVTFLARFPSPFRPVFPDRSGSRRFLAPLGGPMLESGPELRRGNTASLSDVRPVRWGGQTVEGVCCAHRMAMRRGHALCPVRLISSFDEGPDTLACGRRCNYTGVWAWTCGIHATE